MQTNPVLYPKYYYPDAQFQNSTHILFGNYGQFGDYLNPYASAAPTKTSVKRNGVAK